MNKLSNYVLKSHPFKLLFFFILLPFFWFFLTGLIGLLTIFFADTDFPFNKVMLLPILWAMIVYFVWVWSIPAKLEPNSGKNFKWFKISYWIVFSYVTILLVQGFFPSLLDSIILSNGIAIVLTIVGILANILFLVSYIYMGIYAGRIAYSHIRDEEKGFIFFSRDETLGAIFCGMAVCVFPIGIPLLQHKLRRSGVLPRFKGNLSYQNIPSQRK